MKNRSILLMALCLVMVFTTVTPAQTPEFPEPIGFEDFDAWRAMYDSNPVSDTFVDGIKAFTYETAADIFRDVDTNMNYSPLSLYFALSLITNGANGETKQALIDVLHVDDPDTVAEQCGRLFRQSYVDNEIGKLKIANSLWLAESFKGQPVNFLPAFLDTAREHFYSQAQIVDFTSDDAARQISDWIEKHTDGKLKADIAIDPEQILSVVNTIDFYDEWVNRFDESMTATDTFYLASGDEVEVDFMHMTMGSTGFARGDNFTRAALQLKNRGHRMVFILPDAGTSVQALLKDKQAIQSAFEGGDDKFGKVTWQIPKFDFKSDLELNETLKRLGLESVFAPDADFSLMLDQQAFVSDVKQQTSIAIDENGVSAAAFTQIDYAGAAMPVDSADMILTRPFIYGIYNATGNLLFIGFVKNPAVG